MAGPVRKQCLFVSYGVPQADPPQRQAAISLAGCGWTVNMLHLVPPPGTPYFPLSEVISQAWQPRGLAATRGPVGRLLRWWGFRKQVKRAVVDHQPELVLAVMLHGLAALPPARQMPSSKIVCLILDIPCLKDAGRLDSLIIRRGWKRLCEAYLVSASDIYKATISQEFGYLGNLPIVCHNCPMLDYLPEPTWPRDGWLRHELRRQGASLSEEGGCILLRAGAVGECGGIEETLAAMRSLPADHVFLLMGRPPEAYKHKISSVIAELGLQQRAFLWDRPSDEVWKKSLLGADVGHLIHGPFPPGRMSRIYEFNSSLSNNRLFQYMAAELPIIAYDDPRMEPLYCEVPCFRVVRLNNMETDIKVAFKDLGQSPWMRKDLGKMGRQAHCLKYNWERQFAPILARIAV